MTVTSVQLVKPMPAPLVRALAIGDEMHVTACKGVKLVPTGANCTFSNVQSKTLTQMRSLPATSNPPPTEQSRTHLVADFHFGILRPHGNQILDFLKGDLDGAVEDRAGVSNTAAILVHTSKSRPERVGLAHSLLGVHRLHGFVVALDHLDGGGFEQRHALVPLVDVVRVLAQHDAAQEERTSFHQRLIPCHPHLRVHLHHKQQTHISNGLFKICPSDFNRVKNLTVYR